MVGFQNAELGEKPTSWRPVLNIDGAGKLRGEFYTAGGATPIVSSQVVTDGSWHHAVLTAAANTQTLYLDGSKVGSLNGVVTEQSRDYAYLGAGYGSSGWWGLAEGEYRFTGQMDEVAFFDHTLDPATITEHYVSRTAIGQITKVILPSGRVHATAGYDPVNGRLSQHTDENGSLWKVSLPMRPPATGGSARPRAPRWPARSAAAASPPPSGLTRATPQSLTRAVCSARATTVPSSSPVVPPFRSPARSSQVPRTCPPKCGSVPPPRRPCCWASRTRPSERPRPPGAPC
ncbi:LamG domain-containing protein [Streptomyces sp. NPDC091972]|uniref:LamG domain-containing protein n=1 Tax=Streptomyces sp. NPDC091972 TaxID=3366007 RepID=UPI0037FA6A5F